MTRKDYEAIAAAIKDAGTMAHDKVARLMLSATTERIAAVMSADNPRFDRARFLKACGLSV